MPRVALPLLLALFAACGRQGTSGPAAPVISNLVVQRVTTDDDQPGVATITFTFAFFDAQGDVFRGQCEVATNVDSVTGAVIGNEPGIDPDSKSGSVTCVRFYRTTGPREINGTVTLVDRGGNRSNGLGFRVAVRLQPRPIAGTRSPAGPPATRAAAGGLSGLASG